MPQTAATGPGCRPAASPLATSPSCLPSTLRGMKVAFCGWPVQYLLYVYLRRAAARVPQDIDATQQRQPASHLRPACRQAACPCPWGKTSPSLQRSKGVNHTALCRSILTPPLPRPACMPSANGAMQAHRSLEVCNTAVVLTAPAATAPARQCETSSCMLQYARQHQTKKMESDAAPLLRGRHLSGRDSTLAGLAGQQRMCPSVQRSPTRCRCEQVGHRPGSGSCLPRDKPRSCFQRRQLSLQQPLAGRHDEGRGPHRRLATPYQSESAVLQLLKNEEGANVAMFQVWVGRTCRFRGCCKRLHELGQNQVLTTCKGGSLQTAQASNAIHATSLS